MTWLENMPVQRKLRLAMVVTTAVALVLACVFFLVFEFAGYRRNVTQTINALARVTANNSTAAIAFADEADARETLEALRAEPQILVAALYDADGQLFASFSAAPDEVAPAIAPDSLGLHFTREHVVRVERVVQEGRILGTLYLRASLSDLYRRMRIYAMIVLGVLGAAFALAWVLGSILQRTISRPILELAQTADAISSGSDYALRARQYGRDELGRLTGAFNSMLERTQAAVGALRESEARFRHMADGAPVLIWLADINREATWFNQRWVDFVGRPLVREIGRGWLDHLHPDDRGHRERVYRAAFDSRQTFQLEYRLRRQDGEYRWMLDHGIPRFSAEGEFSGYIGSCIDVTDRRQAEQEIAEARDRALAASRAKDDFLARLSHELRTPLNPVLLIASDAAKNPALPEEIRADFDLIAKNVALEARLIDDLLDLTRIVRGKLALDLRVCDLHAVLRDAISTVWPELEAKRIRLTLDLTADRTRVSGDPVRLQQVFWNVLKNAIKFTPEAGSVAIESRTLAEPERVVVKISDTGIGMTGPELARVFEAFAQGEHTDAPGARRQPDAGAPRHFGGLGLGLAISRMLVELHSGAIRATSRGRGLGSTIMVELPITAAQPGALQPEPAAPPVLEQETNALAPGPSAPAGAGSRGRVLLVEDHVPTCRTLAHLLSRRGFSVVSVATAETARAAMAGGPFTFLISDIGLPDGDGVALLHDLREAQPDLRGVALSGYGAEQDIARSRAAGFDDHLTKPINVDALDQAIARLMAVKHVSGPVT